MMRRYAAIKKFNYFFSRYVRGILYAIPIIALATYVALFPGKSGRRIFSFLGIVVFTLFGFIFSKYPGHVSFNHFDGFKLYLLKIIRDFIFYGILDKMENCNRWYGTPVCFRFDYHQLGRRKKNIRMYRK